jgi:hypothetical protein
VDDLTHWLVNPDDEPGKPVSVKREFTGEEINAAMNLVNQIKDGFRQDVAEGSNVVRAFGLPPELGDWCAKTWADTMSVVGEAGGSLEDAAITVMLDSWAFGIALSIEASKSG